MAAEQPALTVAPPAFLADADLRAVLAALPRARLVGGSVRDALAGREVADIDLATPDDPSAVVAALRGAGLKAAPTGLAHGTVTAISGGRGFEVTTLRRDVATDGRHADVAWTEDWRTDAARRDFTLNAMSMDRDGGVFDYFGGASDLRAGRVRFVGSAGSRIAEDYLRLLRFFRFHARYGRAEPDDATLAAIAAGIPGLARLSPERVWSELKRILAAPDPGAALATMDRLGVLAAVLPEGADVARLGRLIGEGLPPDPVLRLAALVPGAGDGFAERMRLSGAERATLADSRGPVPGPEAGDDDIRRALAETAVPALVRRSFLAHGGAGAGLRARLAVLPRPAFALAGRDALAIGVPPGPEVGVLIEAVRRWWLAGGAVADLAACRAELARLVAARGPR